MVDKDCRGAYPAMVNLKDDSVLIVYYEEGGKSNIRARFSLGFPCHFIDAERNIKHLNVSGGFELNSFVS